MARPTATSRNVAHLRRAFELASALQMAYPVLPDTFFRSGIDAHAQVEGPLSGRR